MGDGLMFGEVQPVVSIRVLLGSVRIARDVNRDLTWNVCPMFLPSMEIR